MSRSSLEARLLVAIGNLSRYYACRATDETLAKAMGKSTRTVSRLLDGLQARKEIHRETTPYSPELRAKRRTIYLVSRLGPEDGARKLVRWARTNGKASKRSIDAFCGMLACCPDQLDDWVNHAQAYGWLEVERSKEGYALVRTASAPFYEEEGWQPRGPRPVVELGADERRTLAERILQHVASALHRTDSNSEIAEAFGSTTSSVRVTIGRLRKARKLFQYKVKGARLLSTSPLPEHEVRGYDKLGETARELLAQGGPVPSALLKANLGLSKDQFKKLAVKHGLRATRVCGTWYYSARPIQDEQRQALEQQHEAHRLGLPDGEAVHRAVRLLICGAGLGGVDASRLPCVQGLLMPSASDTALREAMETFSTGSEPVAHCAQAIFDAWREAHRETLDVYLYEQGRLDLIKATRGYLEAANVPWAAADDDSVWFALAEVGNDPARAATRLAAEFGARMKDALARRQSEQGRLMAIAN